MRVRKGGLLLLYMREKDEYVFAATAPGSRLVLFVGSEHELEKHLTQLMAQWEELKGRVRQEVLVDRIIEEALGGGTDAT